MHINKTFITSDAMVQHIESLPFDDNPKLSLNDMLSYFSVSDYELVVEEELGNFKTKTVFDRGGRYLIGVYLNEAFVALHDRDFNIHTSEYVFVSNEAYMDMKNECLSKIKEKRPEIHLIGTGHYSRFLLYMGLDAGDLINGDEIYNNDAEFIGVLRDGNIHHEGEITALKQPSYVVRVVNKEFELEDHPTFTLEHVPEDAYIFDEAVYDENGKRIYPYNVSDDVVDVYQLSGMNVIDTSIDRSKIRFVKFQ